MASLTEAREAASASIKSAWRGEAAGGCPNHSSWRNNPQFVLEVPSGGAKVKLALSTDQRTHVGIYVMPADGEQRRVKPLAPEDVLVITFFETFIRLFSCVSVV